MFWILARLLEERSPEDSDTGLLVGLVATGILSAYTHFFGLVLSGSVLLALLILSRHRSGRLRGVIVAMVVLGIACLGLIPFVLASMKPVGLSSGTVAALPHQRASAGEVAG